MSALSNNSSLNSCFCFPLSTELCLINHCRTFPRLIWSICGSVYNQQLQINSFLWILFSTTCKFSGSSHFFSVCIQAFQKSAFRLVGWECELRSSWTSSWFNPWKQFSDIVSFAGGGSWGSLGVSVSAYCGRRKMIQAISGLRGMVRKFRMLNANLSKPPVKSVEAKDDVMQKPVLSSNFTNGSTFAQKSVTDFLGANCIWSQFVELGRGSDQLFWFHMLLHCIGLGCTLGFWNVISGNFIRISLECS